MVGNRTGKKEIYVCDYRVGRVYRFVSVPTPNQPPTALIETVPSPADVSLTEVGGAVIAFALLQGSKFRLHLPEGAVKPAGLFFGGASGLIGKAISCAHQSSARNSRG